MPHGHAAAAGAAIAVLVGCGSATPPATTQQPTRRATPSPVPHPLEFAVLQLGKVTGSGATAGPDVITILDAQGAVHGRASFQAPLRPNVGNAAAVVQPDAVTAAGSVFFADSTGLIWKLLPDASAAALPADGGRWHPKLTGTAAAQQEISFAVSPEGDRSVALVLTFAQPQTNCQGPCGLQSDEVQRSFWSFSSGTTTSLQLSPVNSSTGAGPRVFGWDSAGPVLLDDAPLGTQDGWPGFDGGPYGHAHQIDAANGDRQAALPAGGCTLMDAPLPDGTTLCLPASPLGGIATGPLTVQGPSAGSGYSVTPAPVGCAGCSIVQVAWARLSPDGRSVALSVLVNAATSQPSPPPLAEVISSTGTVTPLPGKFAPEGWLDAATVIGASDASDSSCPPGQGPGNLPLAVVQLNAPHTEQPLKVCGVFAGVVRSSS